MKTICVAIAALFLALALGIIKNASAQTFTDLGSPYHWARNIWDLAPVDFDEPDPDTVYGVVSTGLVGMNGSLFCYWPPLPGSFGDRGSVMGRGALYSLVKSSGDPIYGGTGDRVTPPYFFRYVPGQGINGIWEVPTPSDSFVCDLTRSFILGDDRIFGGTASNAHFFQYDPNIPAPLYPLYDWGMPVQGETGIWAVTSGYAVADWIVGGTSPNGWIFQFFVQADTGQADPFEVIEPPVGERIRCMTARSITEACTSDTVYFGTLEGRVYQYEPYSRTWRYRGGVRQEHAVSSMTTGNDGGIYFGTGAPPGERPLLYQWNPTIEDWMPGYNPRYWELPASVSPWATRIRSLCRDPDPALDLIYGGTGMVAWSEEGDSLDDGEQGAAAHLFRFDPPSLPRGGGSQTVAVEEPECSFILFQNHPNPFLRTTDIRYQISPTDGGRPTAVSLRVYDICGRMVSILVDGEQGAGEHSVEWNGRDAHGKEVPQGIYFYQLEVAGLTEARKMTLLR